MTTKGDMVDYDTERQRLGIGSTGQVLTVASSLPTWATLTTADSVLTTQGDVLYESASGLARLGFGTSGDVLTTKGTGANPVWETPSGGVTLTQHLGANSSNFTTTSTSYVDVTDLTITASGSSGAILCTANTTFNVNTANKNYFLQFVDDGSAIGGIQRWEQSDANTPWQTSSTYTTTPDSQVIKLQAKVDGVYTLAIYGSASAEYSTLQALEIS